MNKGLRNRLALLLVLLAASGTAAAPAIAADAGGDTSAVAINTKDGSSLFKLAFQIRRVTGDVVDNQNAAVAYASCTQCQTVAISIQVLLVAGSPTVFTPQNVAIAINDQCTLCNTMALAYQFAVGMDTKLKFTHEGKRQLADLRRQLEELRRSDLTIEQIQAKAAGLMDQLSTVLSTELVGVKPKEQQDAPSGNGAGGGSATDTTPTTTEPAPSPDNNPPPTQTSPANTPTQPTQTQPTQTAPPTDTTQGAPPASTTPTP